MFKAKIHIPLLFSVNEVRLETSMSREDSNTIFTPNSTIHQITHTSHRSSLNCIRRVNILSYLKPRSFSKTKRAIQN